VNLLVLLAAALILMQEGRAPKDYFRTMEQALVKAKTLHITFEVEPSRGKTTYRGEILLANENRCRFQVETITDKFTIHQSAISDGATVVWQTERNPVIPFKTPPTMGTLLRTRLARAGPYAAFESTRHEGRANEDPETSLPIEGIKFGAKEKVGEREAQVLEYKIPGQVVTDVTVWIDRETRLPLKCITKFNTLVTRITYLTFLVDEKIDPAKFEIPKEAK